MSQGESPEERGLQGLHRERPGEKRSESTGRPVLNMLGGVAKVAQVLEAQHVADPPPGFVGDTGQQEALAHSEHFPQGLIRIADVFKDLEGEHEIKRGRCEGQVVEIADDQGLAGQPRMSEPHSGRIQIETKHSASGVVGEPAQHNAFSAARIQNGAGRRQTGQRIEGAKESLVGISD